MVVVATYHSTGGQKHINERKARSSPREKTRGSFHQRLLEKNIRKTKKKYANFENKGSGVVYA